MNLAKKVSAALLLILLVAALSVPTFAAGEGQEGAQPTATAQAQEEAYAAAQQAEEARPQREKAT